MRRRHRLNGAVLAVALAALIGACTGDNQPDGTPSQSSSSTPSSGPSGRTSPPAQNLPVLGLAGAGKYQIGAKLSALNGSLQQKESSTACGDWTVAKGVGEYADLAVVFFEGAIVYVSIDQPSMATEAGIRVGSTKDEATAAYPSAKMLSDGQGGNAMSIHGAGGNGLLLRFNQTSATVATIDAGRADDLDFRFTDGEGC